jgi:hypothetical protein
MHKHERAYRQKEGMFLTMIQDQGFVILTGDPSPLPNGKKGRGGGDSKDSVDFFWVDGRRWNCHNTVLLMRQQSTDKRKEVLTTFHHLRPLARLLVRICVGFMWEKSGHGI